MIQNAFSRDYWGFRFGPVRSRAMFAEEGLKMIGWWGAWIVLTLASAALLAGLLLPATRTASHEALLHAEPERILQTLLDVEAQPRWRAHIASVERGADGRSWVEHTRSGERIRFEIEEHTGQRLALGFSSSRGYHGRWLGQWEQAREGRTRLRVHESATVANPLARLLARIAFDPEQFVGQWMRDFEAELARRATTP